MTAPSWVDLAPTVEPVRAWLQTHTGQTVRFARAPKGGVPPFTVLQIVSDPREILTLDGGIPAHVTWQLDNFGETPLQALGLGDKSLRAMVLADPPPAMPGALLVTREALGDGHPAMVAENRYVWQQQIRWTLVGTA